MLTLEEIDRLLFKWQKDIQAASANLSAFEGSTACALLKRNLSNLKDRSKREIGESFADIDGIWEQFSLLSETIKEAEKLRQNMPFIGRNDVIRQIEQLLQGQSIVLKTQEIPLADRGLTGATQKEIRTAPDLLFISMQSRFACAARAASLYETTYNDLTDKVGKALEALDKIGATPIPGLREKLEAISALIDVDPLTGLENFEKAMKKPRTPAVKVVLPPSEPKIEKSQPKIAKILVPPPEPKKSAPTKVDPTVDTDALSKLLSKDPTLQKSKPKKDSSKSLEDLFNRKDKQ